VAVNEMIVGVDLQELLAIALREPRTLFKL
jgi:hypothetical protein